MGVIFNGQEIGGGVLAGNILFDSTDWVNLNPLTGMGCVFFKDNGDGTGQLSGTVGFQASTTSATKVSLLEAPEGIVFSSTDNWTYFNQTTPNTIEYSVQQVKTGAFKSSSYMTVKPVDGVLVASVPTSYSMYVSGQVMSYINFCLATTTYESLTGDPKGFASPAKVEIKYTN